jgi:hypothetical protein
MTDLKPNTHDLHNGPARFYAVLLKLIMYFVGFG